MRYTNDQKIEVLGLLAANDGNIRKTARESGISRKTIEQWQHSEVATAPEIAVIKTELQDARKTLMRDVLHAGLKRILELIPDEKDLHKLAGVVKIVQGAEVTDSAAAILERTAGVNVVPTTRGETSIQTGSSTPTN